ncbi:tetratricopeptide repeat protein [Rhizobium ruizarguesonis]|uniref:tetratricopeptide repeat protein n=1 Tax=Rhizobium ruizarguesonis TaxID=2081791 RepID=UPI0018D58A07|nr:tetratricopeptide repeat protein [Rhizobium ruizarguesonis]
MQAPIAGATTVDTVIAVCKAGGLGSLPSAQLSVDQRREALGAMRAAKTLAIDPDDYNAIYNIARRYLHMGQHETALDLLERVIPIASRFAVNLFEIRDYLSQSLHI